ncbi:MAG: immunoglobulin domain-containing protein, partial [Chitinispirillaceae bacterium]|nr:immunoglobulin domain-containing protein [Chitinispirillaceae bacterium]
NALFYIDSGITTIINSGIKTQSGDTLKKYGKGKLIFTGGISPSVAKINRGCLQIGNNDTNGVLPPLIYNYDTLIYHRSQKPYSYIGNIYGSLGTIIKRGDTSLTIVGNITAKTLIVDSGFIHVGQNGTLGNIIANIVLNRNSIIRFNRSDTLIFAGVISGNGSVVKWGNGTLILTGNNTYTGVTRISTGLLQIGKDSTTGSIVGNVILDTFPLVFKRSNTYTYSGNISGKGKVTQAGKGTLVLSGNHNFTGEIIVADSCSLFINGEVDTTVQVVVKDKATLGGKGSCKDNVILGKGTLLSPGDLINTVGKFSIGSLNSDSTSFINIQIDSSKNDTLSLTKNIAHSLYGKLNITPGEKFGEGRYRIVVNGGTLSNNLSFGTVPTGYNYFFAKGTNFLDLLIYEKKLRITFQPRSDSVILGDTVKFTIGIAGTPPFSYQWLKKISTKDSLISNDTSLVIKNVSFKDSGTYYCIVKDYKDSSITSTTFYLTVLPPPPSKVRIYPNSFITILQNSDIQFSVSAEGMKETFTYTWHRTQQGKDSVLLSGKDTILSLKKVNVSDSGYYFCIVSNGGGKISSDTAYLYVKPLPPVVNFTYSDTFGKAPLFVTFRDISTGVITYRLWKFGDGKTDTAAQVVHMYRDTGTFTVILIVGGPGGVDSLVKRNLISIKGIKDTIIDTTTDSLNPIRLTRLYFDSLSGQIRVGWCIDSVRDIGGEDIEVGITY